MSTFSIRSSEAPAEVRCDGATVTNQGPATVYYSDSQDVSSTLYEGSLASGASATLDGMQFFVVASDPLGPARASLLVGPALVLGSGSVPVAGPTGVAATDTAAIQAAIDTAATAGGGFVTLLAGTYRISTPLLMKTGVHLRGQGHTVTILKLADAANCDVISNVGFSTLTLTGANTWQGSGIWDWGLRDLTIDGNRANQTGVSWGIRVYAYAWTWVNVRVRNCFTDGIWTEWGPLSGDVPATEDGSESTAISVTSHHNGRHGWLHLGPSDCRLSDILCFKNGAAGGLTSIGFWGLQDQYSNLLPTAVAMNGTAATGFTGTFQVNGPTELYASTGVLFVTTSTGTATMTYTGKTTSAFTGCTVTSGSGNFQTANAVKTTTQKFVTNGLQISKMHSWCIDHTWAAVLDGQTSVGDSHFEGATVGQLLVRNATNLSGGFVYDFTGIAPGCGIQLGDDGNTIGLPLSIVLAANACDIRTRVSAILNDTAKRAAVRWVSANQCSVDVVNVTKTTGTYTTTVAAGSNGVDVSTFAGSGVLNVASTQQIPKGAGVLQVATALGNVLVSYTDHNGTGSGAGSTRASGTQFTGCTAAAGTTVGSNLSTGGAVALQNIGVYAHSGFSTLDVGSRVAIHSAGPSYTVGAAASLRQDPATHLGPVRGTKAPTFPPAIWLPTDQGFISWSLDPPAASSNTVLPVAGTLYGARLHCPIPFTLTNLHAYTISGGVTLTAAQCFMAIYNATTGVLIGQTGDLSSGANSFLSGGAYTFAVTGGPIANVPAGDYDVVACFNGTTGPGLARGTSAASGLINMLLTGTTARFFTADTARTTAPAVLGTKSVSAFSWLMGIS